MSYKITQYSRKKARKYNVTIKKSTNPKKKLDVFNKKGDKLASIGAIGYNDFPTFLQKRPNKSCSKKDVIKNAYTHRRLYKKRHEKDRHKSGTPGFWADKLLW